MSQRLKEEYFCWWNQQPLKEGRGKLLYYPQKLAIRNYPVEIGTSSFRIGTSGF
jgi:hypothetical protein